MWKEKQRGLSRAKEGSLLSPPLPSYFFLPAAPTLCRIPNFKRLEQARAESAASSIYKHLPRTLNLQHWRNAVSLRYINRAEITVFMFELVLRFCAGVKSIRYIVNIALSSLLATPTNASINHAIFYSMLSNFLDRVTPKIPDKTFICRYTAVVSG